MLVSCLLSTDGVCVSPITQGVSEDTIFQIRFEVVQDTTGQGRAADYSMTLECSPSRHGTFAFINRSDYRPASLMLCSFKDRHLFWKVINDVLPWQLSAKACCGKWAVENAPCLVIGVGSGGLATPWGSGCGINSRARLAGMGIVQSYLQTTLALLFIVPVSRLLFLPAVTSEKRKATETVG